MFAWSLATLSVIASGVGLDGGSSSPLGVLLVIPVLFGALVYPPLDVGLLAFSAEIAFVLLVVLEPSPGASRSLVTGAMLALAGGISVMASINRYVQEKSAKRLAARLHELATRDGLSGCLSYLAFRRALDLEVARSRRYERSFSLVMADLDNFKGINDTYGHDVGDVVLRGVADAFRSGARAADIVGRVGGDEFAVLLPETDSVGAEEIARRLQHHVRLSNLPVTVTVSYGTASWSGRDDDLEDVIRRADRALYAAKHAGRDRLAVWENPVSSS
jgi:diguanylate cyclase (GGDEF)-like protein